MTNHSDENRFKQLIDNLNELVLELDEAGKVIFANEHIIRILGYTSEELIGCLFTDILHPDEKDKNLELLKNKFAGVLRCRHKNLIYISLIVKSNHYFDNLGKKKIAIIASETTDEIVEHIHIEKELRESKEHHIRETETLQKFIDLNPYPIQIYNTDGFTIKVNPAHTRMFGAVPPPDYCVFKNKLLETNGVLEGMRKIKNGEVVFFPIFSFDIKKLFSYLPSRPMWLRMTGFPIFDANGNVDKMVLMHEDVTDRENALKDLEKSKQKLLEQNEEYENLNEELRQTNEELTESKIKAEESDRLKSAFLANMSHEIRTPMNAIKGFAQLLDDPDLPFEKRQTFINIIDQRTDDLLNLINDILDLSKIESNQLILVKNKGDLKELFSDLFEFFDSQRDPFQSKVDLIQKNNLSDIQSKISVDFLRLRQILINLINNSLKFTKQGHVEFGCKLLNNETLLFYVEDTGIGIPVDKHAVIFERFRQANDAFLSKDYGGTGLGLAIVKNLVEMMHGKVWFQSQENHGATFFFILPYEPTDWNPDFQVAQKSAYNWTNKKILIVDDDVLNAEVMTQFLKKTNAKFLFAENGNEAIEQVIQNKDIDLVLMDIRLPLLNGFDATKKIKSLMPEIPVIIQTAYAAESEKLQATEAGSDAYITKPIDKILLIKLIQEQFDKNK